MKKKATCHNCGQKGHIRPKCPEPMTENDDNKKEDGNKTDKKLSNKKLTLNNKSVQFTNVNNTDEHLELYGSKIGRALSFPVAK